MLREKPAGIDLLAIVMVISGIFCFFSGIDALFFSAYLKHAVPLDTSIQGFSSALSTSAAIWGSVLLALGVGQFLAAYGLFVGSSWAWSASVALYRRNSNTLHKHNYRLLALHLYTDSKRGNPVLPV